MFALSPTASASSSAVDTLSDTAQPDSGAFSMRDSPRLAALVDHLGSNGGCEVHLDAGHARLTSADGGRSTDLHFRTRLLARDHLLDGSGQARLERLAAGALHLLRRYETTDPTGLSGTFWPLPRQLTLDGDVLRSGAEFLGRFDPKQETWRFSLTRLAEVMTLMRPLFGRKQPNVSSWLPMNLYGKDAPVAGSPARPPSGAAMDGPRDATHERVYVVQLSAYHVPEIKGQDLPRVRALQVDDDGRQRVLPAPHVTPWAASRPPSLRVVLTGGTHVDPASGGLRVNRRDPAALAALAVDAVKTLSRQDGLAAPAAPDHISLVTCYLDNEVFEPFGPAFLRAAAGPQGFDQPGLSASVRTQAVDHGTGDAAGRRQILGPGGDMMHRRPGGTLMLTLDGESVRATPKVEEDGRSFILDRGQNAAPLLAWWKERHAAHDPAEPAASTSTSTKTETETETETHTARSTLKTAGADGPVFPMGEVLVTRSLLDRMGAFPQKDFSSPDALLALRFDPARLEAFLAERASPADAIQALRLLAQCLRAGVDRTARSHVRLSSITGRFTPELNTILGHVRSAVDDDLMLPSAVWTALWPTGQAPTLSPRPDVESLMTAPVVEREIRTLNSMHRQQMSARHALLKQELMAGAARYPAATTAVRPSIHDVGSVQ